MNRFAIGAALLMACGTEAPTTPPSSDPPPPWGVPITGGTMLVKKNGTAVVADPDRDRVVFVDLAKGTTTEVALNPQDEPGRLVEDAAGRVHIALRHGGAIVTFDGSNKLIARRAVCAEPRGIAYDAAGDNLQVACNTGELVTLPSAGGDATRVLRLERDLRDVIVAGDKLLVTRFRAAELLQIDATGAILTRDHLPSVQRLDDQFQPLQAPGTVAWKAISLADGSVLVAHQRQVNHALHTTTGGYGGMCNEGPVESSISVMKPGGTQRAIGSIIQGALPVDVALSPDGSELAFAVAGAQNVQRFSASVTGGDDGGDPCNCMFGGGGPVPNEAGSDGGSGSDCNGDPTPDVLDDQLGSPTSVAYTADNQLVAFYPEVPALVVHPKAGTGSARTIVLPGTFGYDAGRGLFHTQTSIKLACASCHPEGRDDGLVWDFAELGLRRTQNVAGHIAARAPYHWTGDMKDIPTLMDNVFSTRMEGGETTHSQKVSLAPWLDRVAAPASAPTLDPAAVARGQALFESTDTACTGCHNGPLMTNLQKFDVGTGGVFKVPSLNGVGGRAPFLHDGSAPTLADRFGAQGGGDKHGHTSQLTPAQISDLTAYLDTL